MAGVGGTGSVLRMSGMNSGLDTEAIVNAMTAATKLKITQNQRKVLKLEAQQEAYRAVMDKINDFKSKYFDILNSSTYLKGASGFNKYSSKISYNGTETTPPGVSVTTNSSAIPGTYDVKVVSVATQAKYTTAPLDSKQDAKITDPGAQSGDVYAMKVTVGDKTKVVSYTVGTTEDDTLANLNNALKDAFGKNNNDAGLVSVSKSADGKYVFNSLEKKPITTSDAVELTNSVSLDVNFTGDISSLTVTINGQTQPITLATVDQDYYKSLFEGEIGADGFSVDASESLKNSFINRVKDMYQEHLGAAYEDFMGEAGYEKITGSYATDWDNLSPEQQRIFNEALTAKQEEQWETAYNKMAESLYDSSPAGKISGEGYVPWNDWLEDFKNTYTMAQFQADRSNWTQRYDDAVRAQALSEGVDVSDDEAYTAWATEYKKTFTLSDFQDTQTDWGAKYDSFVDDEYDRYVAYQQKKFDDDPANDGQTYVAPDETQWKTDFMNTYTVDNYKSKVRGGDVVVAEAEAFYNFSYNEYNAYVKYSYSGPSEEDFIDAHKNNAGAVEAASFFNQKSIESVIKDTAFDDGTKLRVSYTFEDGDPAKKITGISVTAYKETKDADGNVTESPVDLAISANSGYDFGLANTNTVSNTLSTSTKLSELGLTVDVPATYKAATNSDGSVKKDDDGNIIYTDEIETEAQYKMTLNGVDFSFNASTTLSQMMSRVNSSDAGVNMTFSSLTNTFEITGKEYGTGHDFDISGGGQILSALGFDNATYTEGKNLELEINGHAVETASNSYTIDGTTFSFNSLTKPGTEFQVEVGRDTSQVMDLVRNFVKDYNELISFVYSYVDEKPKSDYHFLTDADKEEMELSDKQEEMWETAAKKGILYNDSTLTKIMSSFRTALYSANTGFEENNFALFSMGITTSSNWKEHGKLVINEDKFTEAFEKNFEDITRLFTNSTNGIMTQFEKVIDSAVKPTGNKGERGTLVDKAGVANGSSTTDNTIYNQIKSLNTMISSLERRYEQQQDRYWKIYTALEKQMGSLNSQTGYINQLMGMSGG